MPTARQFALARQFRGDWRTRHRRAQHEAMGRVTRALAGYRLLVSAGGREQRIVWNNGVQRWGLVRCGRKLDSEQVVGKGFAARVRDVVRWRWTLTATGPRDHPDVWFLVLPPGGVLVVPNAIVGPHWRQLMLAPAGHHLWRYWERWDVCVTYPELPDDLVTKAPPPDAARIDTRIDEHMAEVDAWRRSMARVGWSRWLLDRI